ncbi:MAG: hypothetical protein PF501_07590 [Salinisphaera sp.]|jgi:hypothetical protein|nr:hypothetical protein [Salinisphaera sp.]
MSCTPFQIEEINVRYETGHGLPSGTRIAIYMCNVTKFSRAILQVQQGGQWNNSGLAGIGHGRQDAVSDLHLQMQALVDGTRQILRACPWVPQ